MTIRPISKCFAPTRNSRFYLIHNPERFGARRIIAVGAIVMGLGYLASGFVQNIGSMVFTYGVIAGAELALCMAYCILRLAGNRAVGNREQLHNRSLLTMGLRCCKSTRFGAISPTTIAGLEGTD